MTTASLDIHQLTRLACAQIDLLRQQSQSHDPVHGQQSHVASGSSLAGHLGRGSAHWTVLCGVGGLGRVNSHTRQICLCAKFFWLNHIARSKMAGGGWFRHLRLLIRKNFKLQLRRPKGTAAEILMPTVFIVLLCIIRTLIQVRCQLSLDSTGGVTHSPSISPRSCMSWSCTNE